MYVAAITAVVLFMATLVLFMWSKRYKLQSLITGIISVILCIAMLCIVVKTDLSQKKVKEKTEKVKIEKVEKSKK